MVFEVRLTCPIRKEDGPKSAEKAVRDVALEMGVDVLRVKIREDVVQLYGNMVLDKKK